MKTLVLLSVLFAAVCAFGQGQNTPCPANLALCGTPMKVAQLAAYTSIQGVIAVVSDGSSSSDCTTGGGSTMVTCQSNGTTWSQIAGGGSGGVGFQGTPTVNAIVTDYSTTKIQTPSATSTLDSSGNEILAGSLTTGGGSTGGNVSALEGTCSGLAAATYDVTCANSTSHIMEASLNNSAMFPLEVSQLVIKTGTYAATLNDLFIECNAPTTAFTVTLPVTNQIAGKAYHIKNINAATCNVAPASGNIDNVTTFPLTIRQAITAVWDGTQYWIF